MSEETENTFEVVSWYYKRGRSKRPKTSHTKKEVVTVYFDQSVEKKFHVFLNFKCTRGKYLTFASIYPFVQKNTIIFVRNIVTREVLKVS